MTKRRSISFAGTCAICALPRAGIRSRSRRGWRAACGSWQTRQRRPRPACTCSVCRFRFPSANAVAPGRSGASNALRDLGQPPVAALTATATPEVRADIIEQLGLGKFGRQPARVFVSGFARHNLTLGVGRVKGGADKLERLVARIREHKTGIVYCATRKNVERVAKHLRAEKLKCIAYHGGMSDDDRTRAQARFMEGRCDVAVATNAFGMGIDRPDLRFVVHYDIPGSLEAYYQEAGRAGRDGEPAACEVLFNYADVRTQEFFIDGANPTRITFNKIKDRYPLRIGLGRAHIEELISLRLIRHRPGAAEEIHGGFECGQ